MRHKIAGESLGDIRLWHTYLFWARSSFDDVIPPDPELASSKKRVRHERAAALQAILFAAFALEYRLRRTYEALGLATRERDTLWPLIENFEIRETGKIGLAGTKVRIPTEWPKVRKRLERLLTLRNELAHARYLKVRVLLKKRRSSLSAEARRSYNAVIDAIRVLNVSVGYERRRGAALRQYYSRLKV